MAAFAVVTGAMLAFAPQSQAAKVTANVRCELTNPLVQKALGNIDHLTGDMDFSVTSTKTSAKPGDPIRITIDPGPSPAMSPVATTVKITPSVVFAGTSEGGTANITAKGAQTSLKVGAAKIDLAPFDANIAMPNKAKGTLKLVPKTLAIALQIDMLGPTPIDIPCNTTKAANPVLSLTVTSTSSTTGGTSSASTSSGSTSTSSGSTSSGSTSSGSTSSGSTSSGSTGSGSATGTAGGELPKTGPLDDALSMGLLGGTVGLVGIGGVLMATRRVRGSRNA